MRPSVSVIIASYNASWCIERAVDSALRQTAPPREILVCDDGSTDGSADHVERRYGAQVRLLRLPHRNASAARHAGLAIAKGDWLAFLDADDWWEPAKLERQLDFVVAHPEVKWIATDGPVVSEERVERPSWLSEYFEPVRELHGDLFPLLVQRCFPLASSVLVEREAYHAVGGVDPQMVNSHDYDLWLRLGSRFPGAVMRDSLVSYWTRAGSLSKDFEMQDREDLELMERIARGELRTEPAILAAARDRAAEKAYGLGLKCLRKHEWAEGRAFLRRARGAGPWTRRILAAIGSVLPDAVLPALVRMPGLKSFVARTRTQRVRLSEGGRA